LVDSSRCSRVGNELGSNGAGFGRRRLIGVSFLIEGGGGSRKIRLYLIIAKVTQ